MLDPHAEFRAKTSILKALDAPKAIFGVNTYANEHPKKGVILKVIRSGQTAHRWIPCENRIGLQQELPKNFAWLDRGRLKRAFLAFKSHDSGRHEP